MPTHDEQPEHALDLSTLEGRRKHLQHEVHHYSHMLSPQGPITTFVHHNTLHGFQHLPFEQAIKEANRIVGGRGYLANEDYRRFYARGRINDADLAQSMAERAELALEDPVMEMDRRQLRAAEIYRLHLLHGIDPIETDELYHQVVERQATRAFRADVPAAARDALLQKSQAELTAGLERIGRDWTLAHWLGARTGLNLSAWLRERVQHTLAAHEAEQEFDDALPADIVPGQNPQQMIKRCLGALGIADARAQDYLACIDMQFDRQQDATRQTWQQAIWLREEAALVGTIAHRHFGVAGTLRALADDCQAHPEAYAVGTLWQAWLAHDALSDPFSPSDPNTLLAHNIVGNPKELLWEQFAHTERWGGPPLPLSAELRQQIERAITSQLEDLQDDIARHHPPAVEASQLCWIVLHGLSRSHLTRRGFEALEALFSLRGEVIVGGGELRERLQANNPRERMRHFVHDQLAREIKRLHHGRTHSDFLQPLLGEHLGERVNRYMIRACAVFMDEGLAAWHQPERALGFYASWRALASYGRSFDFDGLKGWRDDLEQLPEAAADAVIQHLQTLGIEPQHWGEYLGHVIMQLPGWAGLVAWYEQHPGYPKQVGQPIDMLQYLAVRLFYETLLVRKACQDSWGIRPDIDSLDHYFQQHPCEFLVRRELFSGQLPEHLAAEARTLVERNPRSPDAAEDPRWQALADKVWIAHDHKAPMRRITEEIWRLFHLAQFLGLSAGEVQVLSEQERKRLLATLNAFPPEAHSHVWLVAFERHYRDEILNALALNRGHGRWRKRDRRPKAQVVFCIDEREEAIHRHFEELDPEYESLGAAGFFGVAMSYTALDDHHPTPLCPDVVTPAHRVFEVARKNAAHTTLPVHVRRSKWLDVFNNAYWESKRNLVASFFVINVFGLIMVLPLIGRIFMPKRWFAAMGAARRALVPPVETELTVTRGEYPEVHDHGHGAGEPDMRPIGFTDSEQADRVEALMRNTGLTYEFSRLVIWAGHGSHSENNPHEGAHDCGACGGKHGGPNGRTFAAMANRPAVRALLRERGIAVPDDTWFIGAQHNTCHDGMSYFDTQDIPVTHREDWAKLRADLDEARARSAQERCRRFASAPKDATPARSLLHVENRALDFSQVRPEWGHATNAVAVVGRRAITQRVFLDRRTFVISYDPTQDPDGKFVERILMAVGPVGAGINLEYYFSTVDTKKYGCDTKVPHNVTGMIAVMEGAHSDLRAGLPRQMTEIHEPMRLQLIVEAKMEVLGAIYGRQPAIQQLLNGAWVHLIAMDPDSGAFNLFVPGTGFVLWDKPLQPIPEVSSSFECYRGKLDFIPPSIIREPAAAVRA